MRPARHALSCLVLLLTLAGLVPLRAVAQEDAALRGADTAVIAQGVAALPAPNAVWSVTSPAAAPVDDATYAAQPLGFMLAIDGPLLTTDEATGARSRLSRGEAAFNADGTSQLAASLGAGETPYLRIALEPTGISRDAPDAGPTYTSEPFQSPAGDRDIDLLTAVLDGETSLLVRSAKAPALIYAPDGLRYAVGRAAPQDLAEGDAIALSGPITLFAAEEGDGADPVRVYVAVVGAAVPVSPTPPTPAASAIPTGEAKLSLELTQCPSGSLAIPGGGETPAPCDPDGVRVPVPGIVITLENVGTGRTFTLTTDEGGLIEETIAAGDYRILTFDDVQASTRAVIASCVLNDPLESRPDIVLSALPLGDAESVECQLLADGGTFDVEEAPEEGGTITFGTLACPAQFPDFPNDPPAQVDGLASCDGDLDLTEASPIAGVEIVLTSQDGTVRSSVSSEFEPIQFFGLEPGAYTVQVLYDGAPVPYRSLCGYVSGTGDSLGIAGPIGEDSPQTVGAGERLGCTVLVRNPFSIQPTSGFLIVEVVECPDGTNLPLLQGESVYDCGATPVGSGLSIEVVDAAGPQARGGTDGDGMLSTELTQGTGYALVFPELEGIAYGICGASGIGLAGLIDNFSVGPGEVITCSVSILLPADAAAYQDADSDGDFLTDAQEARVGSDPALEDTDGDGTVDGEEVYAGTDPLT